MVQFFLHLMIHHQPNQVNLFLFNLLKKIYLFLIFLITIKVKVPAIAAKDNKFNLKKMNISIKQYTFYIILPGSAPATGASWKWTPAALQRSYNVFEVFGETVEQSTK